MVAAGDDGTIDRAVRLAVYRRVVEDARPPTAPELAGELGLATVAIEASFRRLADGHAIVLAPGTPYIWMANPFSAIPTPFEVEVGDRRYFGNCIWDALGIPACLHADAHIRTFCPDCSEPLSIDVRGGSLEAPPDGLLHFAVPASRWWEDIGAT
ncbi:MAG: organomercurial lyase [Actinomycetota bacterium]